MRAPRGPQTAGGGTPGTAAPKQSRGTARQAFDRFGDNGTLSKDQCAALIAASNFSVTPQYLEGVWSVYDRDGDGVLDFEEFSTLYAVLANRCEQVQREQQPTPKSDGTGASRSLTTSMTRWISIFQSARTATAMTVI